MLTRFSLFASFLCLAAYRCIDVHGGAEMIGFTFYELCSRIGFCSHCFWRYLRGSFTLFCTTIRTKCAQDQRLVRIFTSPEVWAKFVFFCINSSTRWFFTACSPNQLAPGTYILFTVINATTLLAGPYSDNTCQTILTGQSQSNVTVGVCTPIPQINFSYVATEVKTFSVLYYNSNQVCTGSTTGPYLYDLASWVTKSNKILILVCWISSLACSPNQLAPGSYIRFTGWISCRFWRSVFCVFSFRVCYSQLSILQLCKQDHIPTTLARRF
jgi:hypothetical protein